MMLLQRIRLKGFLGHRASTDSDSIEGFVDIDLRNANLWLIHGPNGGGKSSIWDAVSFSFFKEHRGGGQKFERLIHDLEHAKAEIKVEFILNGQSFQICSEINRPKRKNGSANVSRVIQEWRDNDWETIADGEPKVNEWMGKNIPISYETFISSVLLRQGEADRFIKVRYKKGGEGERKRILMELLQLEFYRELGKRATTHSNQWRDKTKDLEEALKNLPYPSDEEIRQQRQAVEGGTECVQQLSVAQRVKEEELRNSRHAADLLVKIAECEKQQKTDGILFEQATEIKALVRRYRELKDFLSKLDNLWDARRRLHNDTRRLQTCEEKVKDLTVNLDTLSQEIGQALNNDEIAKTAFAEAQEKLETEKQKQQEFEAQAKELNRIEALEREMDAAGKSLEPVLTILSRSEQIEDRYKRYEQLRTALPHLQELRERRNRLREVQEELTTAQKQLDGLEQSLSEAINAQDTCYQSRQSMQAIKVKISDELIGYNYNIDTWRAKIAKRKEIDGRDECPLCGSELTQPEALKRLAEEHKRWHEELSQFEQQKDELQQSLQQQGLLCDQAESAFQHAQQTVDALRNQVGQAQSNYYNAQKEVERSEKDCNNAEKKAAEWADELSRLDELNAEFINLQKSPDEKCELNEAVIKQKTVQASIEALSKQLPSSNWDIQKRQEIRTQTDISEQAVANCQTDKDTADAVCKETDKILRRLENSRSEYIGKLQSEQSQISELKTQLEISQQSFQQKLSDIPNQYANHPACEEMAAHTEVLQEVQRLSDIEEKENKLKEADERKAKLEERISTLRDQLPTKPCRPVADVQAEYDELENQTTEMNRSIRLAENLLNEMMQQQAIAKAKEKDSKEANIEFNYYKRLADALGRKGLEAKIVQAAQNNICLHANKILHTLSSGNYQVELKDKSETEMEILVKDLHTGNQRAFEQLSGGEQFRVAVSIAVAIGQSILGGRTMETLIIDEGFGMLDETNRGLMVKELHRLSTEVLNNGRVIVVSHQEDVLEAFNNRYRISKDKDGYINLEYSSPN